MIESRCIRDIDYIEGLLDAARLCLRAERGHFYPDKNFGSSIKQSFTEPEILSQARLAVGELDGVYVESVCKMSNGLVVFNLKINDEKGQVEVNYD